MSDDKRPKSKEDDVRLDRETASKEAAAARARREARKAAQERQEPAGE